MIVVVDEMGEDEEGNGRNRVEGIYPFPYSGACLSRSDPEANRLYIQRIHGRMTIMLAHEDPRLDTLRILRLPMGHPADPAASGLPLDLASGCGPRHRHRAHLQTRLWIVQRRAHRVDSERLLRLLFSNAV